MHLLQAQQAPALLYAKIVGRPGTGSYPAPLPDPTTFDLIPNMAILGGWPLMTPLGNEIKAGSLLNTFKASTVDLQQIWHIYFLFFGLT